MVMVLMVSTSCNRKVTEAVVSSAVKLDSVSYVEKVRVDTFWTPAETITETIQLECDSLGQVKQVADAFRKGRASVVIRVVDNVVSVEANCDSIEQLLLSKDKLIQSLKQESNIESSIKETVTHIGIPWPYKMAAWIAAFYLIITLLWILWKVFRTYLKAQFPFIP